MITAKVGGHDVPLYMGMKAVTAITVRFGSIAGLCEVLSNKEDQEAKNEATFFVAHHLNVNASVLEEKAPTFKNHTILEATCRPQELFPLFSAVCDAIKESTETTVEAEFVYDNEKNVETTQDK